MRGITMKAYFEKERLDSQFAENEDSVFTIADFKSLDDYFDHCGLEDEYRPAYRQSIIAWLRSGANIKPNYGTER